MVPASAPPDANLFEKYLNSNRSDDETPEQKTQKYLKYIRKLVFKAVVCLERISYRLDGKIQPRSTDLSIFKPRLRDLEELEDENPREYMRQQNECDILRPLIVQKLIYKEIKVALNEDHRADVFELKDEILD